MRRLPLAPFACAVLLGCATLGACAGDPPAEEPTSDPPEAATSAPALPGSRSIDRARDVAAAASDRALLHDTIR